MRNYLVNCDLYGGDRDADYELVRAAEAFEPISTEEAGGGCGNVCSDFQVSRKTMKGKFSEWPDIGQWKEHEEKWSLDDLIALKDWIVDQAPYMLDTLKKAGVDLGRV